MEYYLYLEYILNKDRVACLVSLNLKLFFYYFSTVCSQILNKFESHKKNKLNTKILILKDTKLYLSMNKMQIFFIQD